VAVRLRSAERERVHAEAAAEEPVAGVAEAELLASRGSVSGEAVRRPEILLFLE
jgi:hypothetical protein